MTTLHPPIYTVASSREGKLDSRSSCEGGRTTRGSSSTKAKKTEAIEALIQTVIAEGKVVIAEGGEVLITEEARRAVGGWAIIGQRAEGA